MLEERKNMLLQAKEMQISQDYVVLIKRDKNYTVKWNIQMVNKLFKGKGNFLRGVGLGT